MPVPTMTLHSLGTILVKRIVHKAVVLFSTSILKLKSYKYSTSLVCFPTSGLVAGGVSRFFHDVSKLPYICYAYSFNPDSQLCVLSFLSGPEEIEI